MKNNKLSNVGRLLLVGFFLAMTGAPVISEGSKLTFVQKTIAPARTLKTLLSNAKLSWSAEGRLILVEKLSEADRLILAEEFSKNGAEKNEINHEFALRIFTAMKRNLMFTTVIARLIEENRVHDISQSGVDKVAIRISEGGKIYTHTVIWSEIGPLGITEVTVSDIDSAIFDVSDQPWANQRFSWIGHGDLSTDTGLSYNNLAFAIWATYLPGKSFTIHRLPMATGGNYDWLKNDLSFQIAKNGDVILEKDSWWPESSYNEILPFQMKYWEKLHERDVIIGVEKDGELLIDVNYRFFSQHSYRNLVLRFHLKKNGVVSFLSFIGGKNRSTQLTATFKPKLTHTRVSKRF